MASPAPAPAPASATAPSVPVVTASATASSAPTEVLPHVNTLIQAARLSIKEDKPIQLDYYVDTATAKAFIGEDPETKDKLLVKSREEFTSYVSKLYKVGDDLLITTENSIYIVSGKIQKRKVNVASLKMDD
jgi:hypothetical protein